MDLPIIHKLIEAYKLWQEHLPHFPKTSRYTLGVKIDDFFIETTESAYKTCYLKGEKKLSKAEEASLDLDMLKFFLRIAWEIKALDNKKYAALSKRLDEIGRMLGGWINYLEEKLPPLAYLQAKLK